MKKIKFNYLFNTMASILIFCAIVSTAGCLNSKYIPPELPEWQISHIRSDEPDSVRIYTIDGHVATGTLKGKEAIELPDSIIVNNGPHTIVPCYIGKKSVIRYGEPLLFYSRQEKKYIVRHKITWDKSIKFWIELNGTDITSD